MRQLFRTSCLLTVILWAGCVSQRIVWSPDGTRAAILGDDGLHVCDVDGKLTPVLVKEVKCTEWLPDSQRLIVGIQHELKKWADASQSLPEDAAIAKKHLDAVRDELATASHDWTAFWESTKQKLQLTNEQLALALMCIRDQSAGMPVLKLDQKGQQSYQDQAILEDTLQIYSLDKSGATAGPVLYRRETTGQGVQSLRVAPTGKAVLVTYNDISRTTDQQQLLDLLLVPMDGSQKAIDLGKSAKYPDWSPDGKYVVYVMPTGWKGNNMQVLVGDLQRLQVMDEKGNFLDAEHAPSEDFAGVLFNELSRVRIAKDGRIFFSASEVSLPVAARDFDARPTIFCFDPGKQSTLTRVVPRGAMQTAGDAAQYFELSPDAKYISIPFDDGRVSVLKLGSLASDDIQIVQGDAKTEGDNKTQLASVPVWRTPTELTFVRPTTDWTSREVVRYSIPDKTATVISGDWPKAVGLSAK